MAIPTEEKTKLDPRVDRLLQLIIEARRLKPAAVSAGDPIGQR